MKSIVIISTLIFCLLGGTLAYSTENVKDYLESLNYIAYNMGNGNRAAGTIGYTESVNFILAKLQNTLFDVSTQTFTFSSFQELSDSQLSQISPDSVQYGILDFRTMTYSGSGTVQAQIFAVPQDGCFSTDFSGFPNGLIALIKRGQCDFSTKVDNAIAAGAVGVIVYNYEEQGVLSGTLGSEKSVPVFGVSHELAQEWILSSPSPVLKMVADTEVTTTETQNIIAESPYGSANSIIVVGSHLDSVPAGPGINDNGSGSAANLEMALSYNMSNVQNPNKVRFVWFGAEELGLLGSEYYVSQLVASGDIQNVVCNLNYDMIASPNFMRGIYDGENAPADILKGSIKIQKLFENYFEFEGLTYTSTPFTGRSDYGPFIENGVPAGGLFSGAEEIKDMNGRSQFGGLANTAYDPCYHRDCDNIDNINDEALDQMGKAGYYALLELAEQTDLKSWLNDGQDPSHRLIKKPIHLPSHRFFTKH